MNHVIYLDDIDIDLVRVLSGNDVVDGQLRTEFDSPRKNDISEYGVYYGYDSVRSGQKFWAKLQVELPADGEWFAPSFYTGSRYEKMKTNAGTSALEMGINPNAKAKQVHEKLSCTLRNPSDKLEQLVNRIRDQATMALHTVGSDATLNVPWRVKDNKYRSFEARLRIVLVYEKPNEDNKERRDIVPRVEMNNAIQSGNAIWVAEEMRLRNAETNMVYSSYADIFTLMSDGFGGGSVVSFNDLVPYSQGQKVSCSANLITVDAHTFGKVTPTYSEPEFVACQRSAKRARTEEANTDGIFVQGC